MKTMKAATMNAEDRLIFRSFLVFMSTPLLLLVLAGALQAGSAV